MIAALVVSSFYSILLVKTPKWKITNFVNPGKDLTDTCPFVNGVSLEILSTIPS